MLFKTIDLMHLGIEPVTAHIDKRRGHSLEGMCDVLVHAFQCRGSGLPLLSKHCARIVGRSRKKKRDDLRLWVISFSSLSRLFSYNRIESKTLEKKMFGCN